eukprot:scaffold6657_cov256-Prasinococcus_capsulatus_cf.AAC.1
MRPLAWHARLSKPPPVGSLRTAGGCMGGGAVQAEQARRRSGVCMDRRRAASAHPSPRPNSGGGFRPVRPRPPTTHVQGRRADAEHMRTGIGCRCGSDAADAARHAVYEHRPHDHTAHAAGPAGACRRSLH